MEIPRISVEHVKAALDRGEPVTFVDSRSAAAYASASQQLPGSVRIPPDADVARFVDRLPRDARIIAYCT